MKTLESNNQSGNNVVVNKIGFSGSFTKYFSEATKVGNHYFNAKTTYKFDYSIKLHDECNNGYLDFSFTGTIYEMKKNHRFYEVGGGAIGHIISYFKPELLQFEKLHPCNQLGQPMYIDNIRYNINDGKSNEQISEMYNIPDMKAIETLRNASDNEYLFHYLVFRLGIAETWEKQAKEAIQEIERITGLTLQIEGKDRVYKQLDAEDCKIMEELYQLGYATKQAKEYREREARKEQRTKELLKIEKEYDKAIEKAKKVYEVKKAVVSFGIPFDNVIFYEHSNTLCFNWKDYTKKVPSDLINDLIIAEVLPEGIEVTNEDKGN